MFKKKVCPTLNPLHDLPQHSSKRNIIHQLEVSTPHHTQKVIIMYSYKQTGAVENFIIYLPVCC